MAKAIAVTILGGCCADLYPQAIAKIPANGNFNWILVTNVVGSTTLTSLRDAVQIPASFQSIAIIGPFSAALY